MIKFLFMIVLLLVTFPASAEKDHDAYIGDLWKKYGENLHFKDDNSLDAVYSFNIDCGNNRVIPLIHILLARARDNSFNGMRLETYAESRGGEVRVYDYLSNNKGELVNKHITLKINAWGELTPYGVLTKDTMRYTCSGAFGPIWR